MVPFEQCAARAQSVRRTILEAALGAGTAHIGCALSIVDVLSVLYFGGVLRDPGRGGDRFILSKGHAASALYATLAEAGLLDRDELVATYCGDGSAFAGHPERGTAGVEATGGSLGHGLAIAIGGALADRHDGNDRRTVVLLGDGELNEGSVWEAFALAAHLRLGALTAVIDANGLQGLGPARDVIDMEPLALRLAAFGWDVVETPGHDHARLAAALGAHGARPRCVVARTVKGYGVAEMEGDVMWHYRSLKAADRARVLAALEVGRGSVAA